MPSLPGFCCFLGSGVLGSHQIQPPWFFPVSIECQALSASRESSLCIKKGEFQSVGSYYIIQLSSALDTGVVYPGTQPVESFLQKATVRRRQTCRPTGCLAFPAPHGQLPDMTHGRQNGSPCCESEAATAFILRCRSSHSRCRLALACKEVYSWGNAQQAISQTLRSTAEANRHLSKAAPAHALCAWPSQVCRSAAMPLY